MLVEEKKTKKWLSKTKVKQIYTAEELEKNCKKHKKIVAKRAEQEIKNTLDFILMIIFLSCVI